MVQEKEKDLSRLYARMDADRSMVYLDPYIMKDKTGREVTGIIKVTLNKPAVFAANVIAALTAAVEQIEVQSESRSFDTVTVEEFQRAVWKQANGLLMVKDMPDLDSFAVSQLCLRGRVAALCACHYGEGEESGIFKPDIVPWDTRHVAFDWGGKGLEWASYRMLKGKRLIEREYNKVIKDRSASVLDVWFEDHNEVWLDKEKIFEQEHPYGEVPVVVSVVPLGYGNSLMDENRVAFEGESIFFMIRSIVPELNRLASIMQTINMHAVKTSYTYLNEGGKVGTPPNYEEMAAPGAITPIGLNERLDPLVVQDIQRSALQLYGMLEKAEEQGSLSAIDLGTLQFELSAIALIQLGEGRDQVFQPRLSAKAMFKDRLARMFTRQIIALGGSVDVGMEGHKRSFATEKLKGEYTTTYKYYPKSPKIDMARMSLAQIAREFYDEDTIRADVLQVEDPKKIRAQRYYDLAEKMSPLLLRNRVIKALAEIDPFEAKLMAMESGQTLKAILAGELPPPEVQQPKEAPPMLPMMLKAGGTEVTSARKAAQVQQTPQEEVVTK